MIQINTDVKFQRCSYLRFHNIRIVLILSFKIFETRTALLSGVTHKIARVEDCLTFHVCFSTVK